MYPKAILASVALHPPIVKHQNIRRFPFRSFTSFVCYMSASVNRNPIFVCDLQRCLGKARRWPAGVTAMQPIFSFCLSPELIHRQCDPPFTCSKISEFENQASSGARCSTWNARGNNEHSSVREATCGMGYRRPRRGWGETNVECENAGGMRSQGVSSFHSFVHWTFKLV